MRLLLCLLTCFLFSGSAFAQSVFKVVRKPSILTTSFRPTVVSRTLVVPTTHIPLAVHVCKNRYPCFVSSTRRYLQPLNTAAMTSKIEARFAIPRLTRPENIYGGYNYLRTMTKLAQKYPDRIEPDYQAVWKRINLTNTYNGAHHIVNKSTLEQIYLNSKAKSVSPKHKPSGMNLAEMQHNAPAIFHRLHGNPQFSYIFHNRERQLEIYYKSGMKAVIDDFFYQVNTVAQESGGVIPPVPQHVMEGTYLEAELWAKTFNLRWK